MIDTTKIREDEAKRYEHAKDERVLPLCAEVDTLRATIDREQAQALKLLSENRDLGAQVAALRAFISHIRLPSEQWKMDMQGEPLSKARERLLTDTASVAARYVEVDVVLKLLRTDREDPRQDDRTPDEYIDDVKRELTKIGGAR